MKGGQQAREVASVMYKVIHEYQFRFNMIVIAISPDQQEGESEEEELVGSDGGSDQYDEE